VVSFGFRVQAVRGVEFAFTLDVGSRRAEIGRGAGARAETAEELHLDRDRKVLVHPHGLGRLPMDHRATVALGPARTVRQLFAHEPIFHAKDAIGKGRVKEEMAEAVLESAVVAVIPDFDEAVLNTEGVREILSGRIPFDFRRPSV
jgi:hypothetical protein